MTRRYVYIIAAILSGISLATFFYKWQVLGFPLTGKQQLPVWTIETSIRFDAGPGSIKVNLQIPTLTPGFQSLREFNVSKGYGFSVNYVSGGREAQWAVRRTGGMQTLYYRRVVYEDPGSEQIDTTPPFPPPPVINEPLRTAVEVIVQDVRDHSADTASFTTELLRRCNDPSPDANIELLLADARTSADFVETVTTVLAAARIPARMIRGVILQDQQRRVEPTPWLEVHDGDRWRYYNPDTGAEGLPNRFLIWWRGNQPLVRVEGGNNVEVNFAVQKNFLDSMSVAEQRAQAEGSLLVDFSLFSLPIQTQAVYSVLLMIPIGALIMVFMRNIIGALSFRETRLFWGVVLFTLLVALGLSIRFLLDRLRLLLVPRLGAVLIVVVMLMLVISVVAHKLGLETGLSVALFPMVIIAMTIERMSIVWEERGAGDAIRAGLGSLLVAAVAYLAMGMDWLEHLVFAFPELLLFILALVLLLGRYTGYRLTELRRFRTLAGR
jgi:hypothetical protein